MIRIKFNEPKTKSWNRWIADCKTATHTLCSTFSWGNPFEINDLYRRKSIKDEVYFSKAGPFRGRCAYCESHLTDFQRPDIEHFRPKMKVTDENDNPIFVLCPDGSKRQHPGYYWLAYDWRNLLPSCGVCNQPGLGGIGKRNRFPLAAAGHAIDEAGIGTEKPLLFNPIDPDDADPEVHIGVNEESGLMIQRSDRGGMCIKIFALNDRDQLVSQRRDAIRAVKAVAAKGAFGDGSSRREARRELQEMEKGSLSHTLARRAILAELKAFWEIRFER